MQGEGGNFYVGGGDERGDPRPPQNTGQTDVDASFHSPAWQEAYLRSLTETRPSYDEFKQREREREEACRRRGGGGARDAGVPEAARGGSRGAAGGRAEPRRGEERQGEEEEAQEGEEEEEEQEEEQEEEEQRLEQRQLELLERQRQRGVRGKKEEDETEKFRLSGFFSKQDDD